MSSTLNSIKCTTITPANELQTAGHGYKTRSGNGGMWNGYKSLFENRDVLLRQFVSLLSELDRLHAKEAAWNENTEMSNTDAAKTILGQLEEEFQSSSHCD